MADIRPLRGIRFNPEQVKDLDRVVTQPYDKIGPELKQAYLDKDQHSFVRLTLPDGEEKYRASADLCREWLAAGVLKRDELPALYVYHEEFEALGVRRTRKGFIAVTRVDEYEKDTVLPHERTLSKAKADRLDLLRATRKDYEQIFLLFSDPERKVDRLLEPTGNPDMTATDEYGVIHRVWAVIDPDTIKAVQDRMADTVLLIADGHHRYETALNYRQEMEQQDPALAPDAALRYKTCAFVNVADPGLVIFPTHRFLKNLGEVNWDTKLAELGESFDVTNIEAAGADARLKENVKDHAFVLHAGPGRTWLLRLKDDSAVDRYVDKARSADFKQLDVVVLHSVIIEGIFGITPEAIENHVKYERDPHKAVERVDSGEFQAVLLMNPTRAEQVRKLSELGERMPQKSTDFYPKLISGLVFFDVSPDQTV